MSTTTISAGTVPAGTYAIDPSHSSVGFEVRHMGIATVRGAFRKFQGTVDATGDTPVLNGSVEITSVRNPDAAQARAVQAATEVLPTPPLPV